MSPRVLYICYYGVLEPLGQASVLPYLLGLARHGIVFDLISFEKASDLRGEDSRRRAENVRRGLRESGIHWTARVYHGRPPLLSTAYDYLRMRTLASRRLRSTKPALVHARTYVPAATGLYLRRRFDVPFIFDMDGLMGQEYVDVGHWDKNSLSFRLLKKMERRFFQEADGLVLLTHRIREILMKEPPLSERGTFPVVVAPTGVDSDRFKVKPEVRLSERKELGVENRPVMLYVGSLGSWYREREMAAFFSAARNHWPELFFLVATRSDSTNLRRHLQSEGLTTDSFRILSVPFERVPKLVAAADFGISLSTPCLSKLASSPIKNAEYLAGGLPIVINSGIGDYERIVQENSVGVTLEDFTSEAISGAADRLYHLISSDPTIGDRCRKVAVQYYSVEDVVVPAYLDIYRQLGVFS